MMPTKEQEKEQTREFTEAAKPLMRWLSDNPNSYRVAIVSSTRAELVEKICDVTCRAF